MAMVRISVALCEQVKGRIEKLYEKRIAAVPDVAADTTDWNKLYALCVPPNVEALLLALPEGWITTQNEISFAFRRADGRLLESLSHKFRKARPVKTGGGYYSRTAESFDVPEVEGSAALYTALQAHEDTLVALREESKGVQVTVNNFLKASPSLNAAVKAWPDLRGLLPEEVLTRLDARKEKAERASAPEVGTLMHQTAGRLAVTKVLTGL